jgi:flagellar FliL protein
MAKEDKKKEEEEAKEGGEAEEKKEGEEGAEGEGGEGEEGGKKKGKLTKKKKIILAVVALVVVIAIAVPAVLFLTGKLHKKSATEGAEAVGVDGKAAPQAVFYDMEEFVVNLNVGSKRPSFLKMTVSLEVAGELQIPTVERNMPRVRDSFQTYLRELRQEDLQGSAGLYRLREELLLRVNKVVYPAKINDILFKEVLVQ